MLLDKRAKLDQASNREPNKLTMEEVSSHGTDKNFVVCCRNFFRFSLFAKDAIAESDHRRKDSR